ncbi:peptidylprolyl isomerase [Peribacillus saganii]|uniref:Peptidyl-prolyl cis-trans isomerase n=1 Tax=Peribacillus saganii TaxID=2303992 RepID=A0A372LP13_9BACI|nr:peptidylprolyl isomerase [Peribacillus saganii]RFU69467.1 peptidylprolyl isomerase [Peribacillus saganii]
MKYFLAKHNLILAILAAVFFLLTGCGSDSEQGTDEKKPASDDKTEEQSNYPDDVKSKPVVTISMEDGGKITLELYPDVAPNTVANFISLIEKDFYNGVIFHRVIPGFMIQGGDPEGNGTGGPDYSIAGEFSANDFENNLKHTRGILSMARTQEPNSAGSQFFIMVADAPSLDGAYAAFGKVLEGMDVVDEIVAAEHDGSDKPVHDQKIKTVEVDTKGYDYPEPERQ